MARSLSSKKRIRQNVRRRALNRSRRSSLRSKLHKCEESTQRGSLADTEKTIYEVCRALDRGANQGTLHRNAAARRKSRLARRLNALKKEAAGKSA